MRDKLVVLVAVGIALGAAWGAGTAAQETHPPMAGGDEITAHTSEAEPVEDTNFYRDTRGRIFWHEGEDVYEVVLMDMGEYKIFALKTIEE